METGYSTLLFTVSSSHFLDLKFCSSKVSRQLKSTEVVAVADNKLNTEKSSLFSVMFFLSGFLRTRAPMASSERNAFGTRIEGALL